MPAPRVSVVIPTYQRRHLLPRVVEGVLRQRGVETQVVVVDDASPANHPRGLPVLDDPRVTFIEHERNLGQSAARNTGIGAAEGDWIAFLDDDDLWAPDKLALQVAAAEAAGAPFAYGDAVVLDEDYQVTELQRGPDPAEFHATMLRIDPIPAGASNVLARADVVRETGGFDTTLDHVSDWDMWLRLAAHGVPAAVDEVVIAYLKHGSNFSIRGLDGAWDEFGRFRDKHRAAGQEILPRDYLRWMAWNERINGRGMRSAVAYMRAAVAGRDPSDLARAATAFLGERTIRRLRPLRAPKPIEDPAWIAQYR